MKTVLFVMMLLLVFGCTGKEVPGDVIQPGEMKNILWDMTRAESLSGDLAVKDSAINRIAAIKVLSKEVFRLHHISQSDFEKSYLWYTGHPDIFKVMLDSMSAQNARSNRLEIIRNTQHPFKLDSAKRRLKYE